MSKNIAQRRQTIVDLVGRYGTVSIAQLREVFPDVSEVTLRKDLKYLDMNQQLIRTHGAAKSVPSVLNYFYRSNIMQAEKKAISHKALDFIHPGDSIFIAAGTTCAELAKLLPNYKLSICSDGVYTVSNIPCHPQFSVELLGGVVDLNVMRIEDAGALSRLEEQHFNTCFLGAFNFHPDFGSSYMTAITSAILRKATDISDQVVVLADSSKINLDNAPHRLPVSVVDTLITDDKLNPDFAERIRSKGIQLIQVETA